MNNFETHEFLTFLLKSRAIGWSTLLSTKLVARCKYCNFEIYSDIGTSEILPICISDEEKIIKDLLE